MHPRPISTKDKRYMREGLSDRERSERNHPCHPPAHRVTTKFTVIDSVHCNAEISADDFTMPLPTFLTQSLLLR